jgi:anti-sigma factor RsiW
MTMPDHDDELLMAYADGELEPERAATVEEAMTADPEVARRVEAFREDRRRLGAAFAPVADEAVPDRLIAAILAPGRSGVADLGAERAKRRPGGSWAWPQGLAMAACLAGGLAIGLGYHRLDPRPLVEVEPGLVASGPLAGALDRQLGGSETAGPVRVGLSFRAMDGRYCRTFVASAAAPVAGLACREDDGWRIRMAMTAPAAPQGDYRLAAADVPAPVLQAVEGLIDGAPLDAVGEAAASKSGWRAGP